MTASLAIDVPGVAGKGGEAFGHLDDPQEWPSFSRPLTAPAGGPAEAARWESQFIVEGMHCAACAIQIESALAALPGVERVDVDVRDQRVRVRWMSTAARPSQWLRAAARAGYRLVPAGDLGARMHRQRESRLALWRWLVAGLCMMQVMMYAYPAYTAAPGELAPDSAQLLRWASWVLSLPVILFSSGPFFKGALLDLRRRAIGMDLPVALGIAITFIVSSAATFDGNGPLGQEVYFDSLTMFVFFLLSGRLLESRLRDRTAGALDVLVNRMPDSAQRRSADGCTFERVAVARVAVGDVLLVLPGERFVADGRIVEGSTLVDEALLSGESQPLPKTRGEPVLAGAHNLSSPVQMEVQACGRDTRLAGIVALMDGASSDRPHVVRIADRIARPFLMVVMAAAILAAVAWWPAGPGRALMVAVSVLIVTCPCALSLAAPAAMLASAGRLARSGLLVRELRSLETLASVDTVVFDKTGTLTRDPMRLTRIYARDGLRPREALERAGAMAAASLHPAARGLAHALQTVALGDVRRWELVRSTEHVGQGIEGLLKMTLHDSPPRQMRLGSAAWCGTAGLDVAVIQIHLSDDQGWAATFLMSEDLRPDAVATVASLRAHGLQVHLLSGDRTEAARALAEQVGIEHVRGGCSPEQKLDHLQTMQAEGRRVLMVGDGLNDGPVLAAADVSLAFGRQAAPLAQGRADAVALGEQLGAIEQAWSRSVATMRVVRQNLAWAAGYNLVCIPLALGGWLPAWLAGLGMALSSLAVVANAARLARAPRAAA